MSLTNVLKCNSCNLVVNELLTFVQNKHEVMDSESLVQICTSAFSTEDIEKAKCLLFQSIATNIRQIKRKNKDGKNKKDLFDILDIFKSVDPEKFPTFVAHDLNKLPPITFDHVDVSRLLKDILILQNEIKVIKNSYVTADQLLKTKMELIKNIDNGNGAVGANIATDYDSLNQTVRENSYRNINLRRGACLQDFDYDSGPIGLPHMPIITQNLTENVHNSNNKDSCVESPRLRVNICNDTSSVKPVSYAPIEQLVRVEAPNIINAISTVQGARETEKPLHDAVRPTVVSNSKEVSVQAPGNSCLHTSNRSYAHIASAPGEWKQQRVNSEWTLIQRNRHKNRFIGQKGVATITPDCKFKAADVKLPLFINNVDKGASPNDIADYIKTKTQVSVTLEKIIMKKQKEYDAYKILVPRHKLAMFMTDHIWPEGISFRRFIDFSNRRQHSKLLNGQQANTSDVIT